MAWTNISPVVVKGTLPASTFNNLINNTIMGHPVFATEAARDAAITSPSKGQMAYITTPPSSTTTATGATTFIPVGITTIYNGAGWVCVTEVGAFTSAGGTINSGTYTTTLGGSPGTNPSVTLTTGTTALVTIGAQLTPTTTMTIGIDIAVTGATTQAAGTIAGQNLNVPKSADANLAISYTHSFIASGLTAGVNKFELSYYSNNSGNIGNRRITVKGIA
jgi:hypothetical protein